MSVCGGGIITSTADRTKTMRDIYIRMFGDKIFHDSKIEMETGKYTIRKKSFKVGDKFQVEEELQNGTGVITLVVINIYDDKIIAMRIS